MLSLGVLLSRSFVLGSAILGVPMAFGQAQAPAPMQQAQDPGATLKLAREKFDRAEYADVISSLSAIRSQSQESAARGEAILLTARANYSLGKPKVALDTLAKVSAREIPGPMRADFFSFWARVAGEERRWLESALAMLKARAELTDAAAQRAIESKLSEMIDVQMSEADLSFLAKEYPTQFPANKVLYRLATLRISRGQKVEAEQVLAQLKAIARPGTPDYTKAEQLANRLGSLETAMPRKVGLLLPLSGPQESAGRAIRMGLELAIGEMSKDPIEIVAADAGDTKESALQGLERLLFDERVMLVVGPVSGDQAELVAERAGQLGVPNISLSPRRGILEKGSSVFRVGLTPERQVRALVGYSYDRLGARRFAILFPEDAFGREFATEYFRIVQEYGAEVTAAESYAPSQADFKIPVENMTGTGFPNWRSKEAEELRKKLDERLAGTRKATKRELESAKPGPIVDFDVVFIPDSFRALGQIVPTLLYSNVTTPKLLGPNTWKSNRLLERAGQYLDGALFVDMFAAERNSKASKDFLNLFQSKRGTLPNSLNALGYDVGTALRLAYGNESSPASRDELRTRLEGLGTFEGVLGQHRWDSGREVLSELQLFEVRKGAFHHLNGIQIKRRDN